MEGRTEGEGVEVEELIRDGPVIRLMPMTFGRWNRVTYWVWLLPTMTASFFVYLRFGLNLPLPDDFIATTTKSVCLIVCVPRLHDVGRSGWWGAAVYAVYALGEIAIERSLWLETLVWRPVNTMTLWGSLFPLSLLFMGVWPGQKNPNKFGYPPPRGFAIPFVRRRPPEEDVAETFS